MENKKKSTIVDYILGNTMKVPKLLVYTYYAWATLAPPSIAIRGNIQEENAEAKGTKQGIELMHTIYNTQGGNEMLNPTYYANNQ